MEAWTGALSLAAPADILQPFRIGDPAVWDLLQLALAQGIQTDFVLRVMESIRPPGAAPAGPGLTDRERQILRLLAAGKTSTQIAADLVIAVSTARSYIKEIHRKLDVHTRAEAVAAARRLNLL
jgi:DNA-binding CsgD family transcriptional regulator